MKKQKAAQTHLRRGLRRIPRVPESAIAFMKLARSQSWMLRKRALENLEQNVSYELVYEDRQNESWLYYVEDLLIDLPYVTAYGREQESLANLVAEKLNAWPDEDLFAAWDHADSVENAAQALLKLGVAAPPEHSEPFFIRIGAGLEHDHQHVRNAAATAVAYRGWLALKPTIIELESTDPDEAMRRRCRMILDKWDEHAEEQ